MQAIHSVSNARWIDAISSNANGAQDRLSSIREVCGPHDRRNEIHERAGIYRRSPDLLQNGGGAPGHIEESLHDVAKIQHDPGGSQMHTVRTVGGVLRARGGRAWSAHGPQQGQGHQGNAAPAVQEADDECAGADVLLQEIHPGVF